MCHEGNGHTIENVNGTLRISSTGTDAQFRVLLALGSAEAPATVEGSVVTVGQTVVDFDNLRSYGR